MGEEFDWHPPSEAEMKVIQARRERANKISQLMGNYLLKGYKMLATTCTECGTILLRERQGSDYCIACNELDSDVNKDNPAVSHEAALSQAMEGNVRNQSSNSSETLIHSNNIVDQQQGVIRTSRDETSNTLGSYIHHQTSSASLQEHSPTSRSLNLQAPVITETGQSRIDSELRSRLQASLKAVEDKLNWATNELQKSTSVELSIQLCNLIKTCAETIPALTRVQPQLPSLSTGEEE